MTEPEYRKRIDDWVDAHTGQMLEDLKTLVRIPSVRGDAKEGMPYGEMPAQAVLAMQELMERYGFRTTNYENYCVAGDMDAEKEKTLDILAHLDVVPVSDNWSVTAPFTPKVEGDRIYGRGTCDDKGPAIAALYAMRCVRELALPLKHGVRLICGSDEECGSSDLAYYYSREQEALHTFSPDGDYPLINIEKGRLQKSFFARGSVVEQDPADSKTPGERRGVHIKRIRVGSAENIVPGIGTLVLTGVSEEMLQKAELQTLKAAEGVLITWSKQGEDTVVTVKGRSSHAAHPMGGLNSATLILEFLKNLDRNGQPGDGSEDECADQSGDRFGDECADQPGDRSGDECTDESGKAMLPGAGNLWFGREDAPGENMLLRIAGLWPDGEYHGESLGINYSDEESGALTMALTILNYNTSDDGLSFEIRGFYDCRAPLCCNDSNLTQKMRQKLHEAGFRMEEGEMVRAHYVSPESELVKKLLESYELYFEKKGTPIAVGGGTYVHELERGVAFGCAVPEVDNRMHGDDEFMEIPMLVRSTKVFADAIMRLCGDADRNRVLQE